jgi:hypothetical protein
MHVHRHQAATTKVWMDNQTDKPLTDHRHHQRAHIKEAICDELALLVVHSRQLICRCPEQRHGARTINVDGHHGEGCMCLLLASDRRFWVLTGWLTTDAKEKEPETASISQSGVLSHE